MLNVADKDFIKIINQIKKTQGDLYSSGSFSLLPWFIVCLSVYIIIVFLIKIELNMIDNWEIGKCSSKYVFFSGFMNNEGMNPMQKSLDNFNECVKRFI